MSRVLAIAGRELKSYFNSPIAYLFASVFIVLTSWLFFNSFFAVGQATMRWFFVYLPWIFMFMVPAVTMRLWAEEKMLGTLELLMTLPVRDHETVLGKYVAALIFLTMTILLTFPLALVVLKLGKPDVGPLIGGYLGSILLGASFLAIGTFCSSLSENQIVAFIITVVLSFVLFIVGEDIVLAALPDALRPFFKYLGIGTHFGSIGRGVVDSRDIVYYLSLIGFFLFLNLKVVESRKWRGAP